MFICHSCGSDVHFSPEKQKLVCDYCGNEYTTKEYNEKKALGAKAQDDASYAVTVFTCPQCGGEILTQDDTAATFCSYCDASVMLDRVIREEMKPDYVIPFKVTKEQCEAEYRKMIKRSRYLPDKMKKDSHISQFRAIYMPYWVYEGEVHNTRFRWQYPPNVKYEHLISEYYDFKIDAQATVEGVEYDASSTFADQLSAAIAPYDLSERVEFHPGYLSGFYADSNDLAASVYDKEAEKLARKTMGDELSKLSAFKTWNISSEGLQKDEKLMSMRKPKLAFYPVWFLSSRYGNRVSYAVVNGQTGKSAADLPMDFGKYLLTSLMMAVPLFLILNLFLTLSPTKLILAAMALCLYAIQVARRDEKQVHDRAVGADDAGRQYMEKKLGIYSGRYRGIRSRIPIPGVILGLVTLVIQPAEDLYFYGAAAVILLLVGITFLGIVTDYNTLSTRKLPQLNRRGGERS